LEATKEVAGEHLTIAEQADNSSYKIVISVYGQPNLSMMKNKMKETGINSVPYDARKQSVVQFNAVSPILT
jgi:hypothetical protein